MAVMFPSEARFVSDKGEKCGYSCCNMVMLSSFYWPLYQTSITIKIKGSLAESATSAENL